MSSNREIPCWGMKSGVNTNIKALAFGSIFWLFQIGTPSLRMALIQQWHQWDMNVSM